MIRVLALNGSPRSEKGNTHTLVDAFIRGMQKGNNDLEVTTLFTKELDIKNCQGCFKCWNMTPGKCIFQDDMLKVIYHYLEADIIIYATPLYYYGMTSSLKKLVERLLPLNKPYMIKKDGEYTHPPRYEEKPRKTILISTCGFPERHHFDAMVEHFKAITGDKLNETILCTEGEILGIDVLTDISRGYIEATEKAGYEFVSYGKISTPTHESLAQEFTDVETFVDRANMYWNVPNDTPPSYEETHGHSENTIAPLKFSTGKNAPEVLTYIKDMVKNFNPNAAKGLKSIIQIEFTDIGEVCFLKIEKATCSFHKGKAETPTTIIKTPSEIWLKIGQGELQGAKALFDGLYSVHGDFTIMLKMNELFPSEGVKKPKKQAPDKGLLRFISPMVWLSILSFVPWYIFWFSITENASLSAFIPLLISLTFFLYRKTYIEWTSFDLGNVVFFSIMFFWQLINRTSYISYSDVIGSIGLAIIWCSSLMTGTPITAGYSKWEFSEDIVSSSLFIKVNEILTVFWVIIYLLQAVGRITIPNNMTILKDVLLYGILIIAGFFTTWFSNWYPAYAITGKNKTLRKTIN